MASKVRDRGDGGTAEKPFLAQWTLGPQDIWELLTNYQATPHSRYSANFHERWGRTHPRSLQGARAVHCLSDHLIIFNRRNLDVGICPAFNALTHHQRPFKPKKKKKSKTYQKELAGKISEDERNTHLSAFFLAGSPRKGTSGNSFAVFVQLLQPCSPEAVACGRQHPRQPR